MLAKNRRTLLVLLAVFVFLNAAYFTELFGSKGVELYRTVKVKVEAVTEEAIGTGNEAWESVKNWPLWDPLEWGDEGGGDSGEDTTVEIADDELLDGSDGEQASPGDVEGIEDESDPGGDAPSGTVGGTVVDPAGDITGHGEPKLEEQDALDAVGMTDGASEMNATLAEEFDEAAAQEEADVDTMDQVEEQLTLPQLCEQTQWTPGLYLECHTRCGVNHTSVCGGLNNARNRIQTCLRLAIDAGATLILASATTRGVSAETMRNLRNVNFETVPTDRFWNVQALRKSLQGVKNKRGGKLKPGLCEQFTIREWNDYPDVEAGRKILAKHRQYKDPPIPKGNFRQRVDNALEKHGIDRAAISEQNPVLVEFGDSFTAWNYEKSNEMGPIRSALFSALTFNKDLLEIGESVLRSRELAGGFIGIHLRGEKDWPSGFGRLGLQMKMYIREIRSMNANKEPSERVTTLYVSCGTQSAIDVFRRNVKNRLGEEYVVVDKVTLLKNRKDLLKRVKNLSFDERAIVEYKTLVEAKYFLGLVTSTMSNLIAYARTVDEYVGTGKDFFEDVLFKGSVRKKSGMRLWRSPRMKGVAGTKLLVLNARDIMNTFP